MSGVQMITVTEDDGGQRIDRWLRRLFPHVNQGRIEKMCRKGELRLDGGRVKANTRVEAGQVVRVPPLAESDMKPAEARPVKISDADAKMIRDCVVYKDDDVLVINKPAGLAVLAPPNMWMASRKRCVLTPRTSRGWCIVSTRTPLVCWCWRATARPRRG